MRAGDDRAVVAEIAQSTTVAAENLPWACRGPDEVSTMLREMRERFPGLRFEPSTRHVEFGVVIEQARVRDRDALAEAALAAEVDDAARAAQEEAQGERHPMWDTPVRGRSTELVLWTEAGPSDLPQPPVPLNLPVRVTVLHDDLQVHEVRLSFPAALLRRALGQYVDPLEMSLSEVQSAFIAPPDVALTTHALDRPDPAPVPAGSATHRADAASSSPRPRRRRRLVLVVVALLAVVAAASWWVTQDRADSAAAPPSSAAVQPSAHEPAGPPDVSGHTSTAASSTAPTVTRAESSTAPQRTPNVTLRSDLAFGFNSARLSPAARAAVTQVALQVRRTGLTGTIYVDGFTDDIGSTSYGMLLSQRRADAVSDILRSHLLGVPVTIASVGHGESDPIASNATDAGRQENRRVTITLPRS